MKTDVEIKGNLLLCPHCGESYLHQENASVFWQEEGEQDGSVVLSNRIRTVTMPTGGHQAPENPSKYRDGLSVFFSCEFCPTMTARLNIYQHKGHTFIEWASEAASGD